MVLFSELKRSWTRTLYKPLNKRSQEFHPRELFLGISPKGTNSNSYGCKKHQSISIIKKKSAFSCRIQPNFSCPISLDFLLKVLFSELLRNWTTTFYKPLNKRSQEFHQRELFLGISPKGTNSSIVENGNPFQFQKFDTC